MQAITTKYIGPTNTRGSRIKAECEAGSFTVRWDRALNVEENHIAAAQALRNKIAAVHYGVYGAKDPYWGAGKWVTGGIKGAGYAHVRVMDE